MALDDLDRLKDHLDESQEFPCYYMFKFIVPRSSEDEVVRLLDGNPYTSRSSSSGKYVSLTADIFVTTSDQVVQMYREAATIEGIISL